MVRRVRFVLSVAFGACVSLVGCNAILGNEEGTPRVTDAGPTSDASLGGDGGFTPAAPTCGADEKLCFGVCSKKTDPAVGCSATSCEACDPKNIDRAACSGTANGFECGYAACRNGFQDCDGAKGNGCETSTVDQKNCGTCGRECKDATPFCASEAGVPNCVNTCPAGTTPCNGACVDTTSDIANCGACAAKCERPGALARCTDSKCEFTCNPATSKLCAAKNVCVSPSDPAYCLDCNACPPLDGTIASCSNGACRYQCQPGRYDCDRDSLAANGCESTKPCDPCALLQCAPILQKCCEGKCIGSTQPCLSVAQ